jgi:uncharacterized membrane protein (UPF0136 family)
MRHSSFVSSECGIGGPGGLIAGTVIVAKEPVFSMISAFSQKVIIAYSATPATLNFSKSRTFRDRKFIPMFACYCARPPTPAMTKAYGLIADCCNYLFFSTDPTADYLEVD